MDATLHAVLAVVYFANSVNTQTCLEFEAETSLTRRTKALVIVHQVAALAQVANSWALDVAGLTFFNQAGRVDTRPSVLLMPESGRAFFTKLG